MSDGHANVLIEAYLDELAHQLRPLPGAELRRVLAEADDHLRASLDRLVASGMPEDEAATQAIALFGPATTVAGHVRVEHPAALGDLTLDAVRKLSVVLVIGLCGIGLSGLVSVGLGTVFGKSFIAGDAPGVTYTAARCAEYLSFHPEARSCAAAATAHHFDEVVGYRQDLGVLGLIGIVVLLVLRRRGFLGRWLGLGPLPRSFPPTVSTALFGVTAAGLTGLAVMSIAFGVTNGAGSLLSDGLVSATAFALSATWLVGSVRRSPSTD